MLFQLAGDDRGLNIDISTVPDDILKKMVDWRNERVEEEKLHMPNLR